MTLAVVVVLLAATPAAQAKVGSCSGYGGTTSIDPIPPIPATNVSGDLSVIAWLDCVTDAGVESGTYTGSGTYDLVTCGTGTIALFGELELPSGSYLVELIVNAAAGEGPVQVRGPVLGTLGAGWASIWPEDPAGVDVDPLGCSLRPVTNVGFATSITANLIGP